MTTGGSMEWMYFGNDKETSWRIESLQQNLKKREPRNKTRIGENLIYPLHPAFGHVKEKCTQPERVHEKKHEKKKRR